MAAWRRDPEAQPGSGGAVVSHGADGKSLRCRGHRRRAGGTHRRPLSGPGPLPGRGRGKEPLRRADHHYRRSGQFSWRGADQRRRPHGEHAETGRVLRRGISPGGGHRAGSHRRCENRADQPVRFEMLRRPAGHWRPSPHGGLPGGGAVPGPGRGLLCHLRRRILHRQGRLCGGRRLRGRRGERVPYQVRPPRDHPDPGRRIHLRPSHGGRRPEPREDHRPHQHSGGRGVR